MARRLRSALLLILLGAIALIVALWPQLLSYAAQYALRSAQSPSLKLTWTGAKGSRTGVSFDSIDALAAISTGNSGPLKSVPVRLSLSNVQVQPSFISAMLNQQAATFSASIFGGSISGSVSGVFGSPSASIAWSHIDASSLALLPEIRALGIRQGLLEGTASFSGLKPAQVPNSVFSVNLRDFNIPNTPLNSILKLQPSDILTISVSGSSTPDVITLEPITVIAPFGKLQSRGTIGLSSRGGLRDVILATDVSLSSAGSDRFGAWLPLLTNNQVTAGARSFSLRSKTVPCSGSGNLQTLSLGGQTLCFSNRVEQSR